MCINPHLRRYIMKSFYILAVLLAFSSVSSLAQPSFAQDDEVQESTEADTASPDEESDEAGLLWVQYYTFIVAFDWCNFQIVKYFNIENNFGIYINMYIT